MNILIYEGADGRKIAFEPDKELPENFVLAKKWLNSVALISGHFAEYCFNMTFVRSATTEEANDYEQLKTHSVFALNTME